MSNIPAIVVEPEDSSTPKYSQKARNDMRNYRGQRNINIPQPSLTPSAIPTIQEPSENGHKDAPTTSRREMRSGDPIPAIVSRHSARRQNTISGNQERGSGPHCDICSLAIAGRIISAAGYRFHPKCFTCHHCSESLECVAFYPEPEEKWRERGLQHFPQLRGDINLSDSELDEGLRNLIPPQFYCHLDFHELFSPRCKSCKTPIEKEIIVACGAEWHVGHFFCAQCGDPFEKEMPFVEKDGYAWCVKCHKNRYSAKCRGCKKPVTELVVSALGFEWHEECFKCMECAGPFANGVFFLRDESQEPICLPCEERRLKA